MLIRGNAASALVGAAFFLTAAVAAGAVVDSQANGFSIEEITRIEATPDKVYAALTAPQKWWNSQHTFSQDAANMSLDARAGGCLCEKLPMGGSVLHATVVDAEPGSTLRLRGPLGPFQGQGVDSVMTFSLKRNGDATELTLDNRIGGYMKGGFEKWPQAADAMLTDLVTHLKYFVENGKPMAAVGK
jgi:uncharacterized protein YndB with AHSA1/START domain